MPVMENPTSSTPTRDGSSPRWTSRRVAGQCFRRAALAFDQIRGGLSPRLQTVCKARGGIARYLSFYNSRRPHSSLDRHTPDRASLNALAPMRGQHNRGGNPLSKTSETVQPNRATSFLEPRYYSKDARGRSCSRGALNTSSCGRGNSQAIGAVAWLH